MFKCASKRKRKMLKRNRVDPRQRDVSPARRFSAEPSDKMWFADVVHSDGSVFRVNSEPIDMESVEMLLGHLELDNEVCELRLLNARHYRG